MLFDDINQCVAVPCQANPVVVVAGITLQRQGIAIDRIIECLRDGIIKLGRVVILVVNPDGIVSGAAKYCCIAVESVGG